MVTPTFPSELPGSVRSGAAGLQGRAPTDRSLPTPPLTARALCPTPGEEEERRGEERRGGGEESDGEERRGK